MDEKMIKHPKVSLLKWMNPAGMLEHELEKVPWYIAIIISGIAFGLLFWQTGLDQRAVKEIGIPEIATLAIKGILMGTLGVIVLSFFVWVFIRITNKSISLEQAIKQMALSYTAPMVGLLFGLILNIAFGSRTAIAFGISGVLWSLNPIFRTIKKASKDRIFLSLFLTTAIGLIVMLSWDFLV